MRLSCLLVCTIILEASGTTPKVFELPSDFLYDGMMGNNTFYTATIDKHRHLMIWLTNFGDATDHLNVSNHDPDLMGFIDGHNLRFLMLSWNQPQIVGNEANPSHLVMEPKGTVLIGSSGAKIQWNGTLLLATIFIFLPILK